MLIDGRSIVAAGVGRRPPPRRSPDTLGPALLFFGLAATLALLWWVWG